MATDDWNEPLLGDSQDYAETPGRQVRTSHTDSSASGDYSLLADAEGALIKGDARVLCFPPFLFPRNVGSL